MISNGITKSMKRAVSAVLALVMILSVALTGTVAVSAAASDPVVITSGTSTYSLFNSGATSSNGYDHYRSPNPAPATHNNNGYDLMGDISSAATRRFRLGQSFRVDTNIVEQSTLSVKAYDVDEDVKSCGHGYEYDYIYLIDETDNTSIKLDGHLSGTNETWNNSSFKISPNLLNRGHTYHFELEMSCTGSTSCRYYSVTVRTVSLIVSGNSSVANEEIEYADLKASISTDGLVSVDLTANAKVGKQYTLEYKVVSASGSEQRGFKEYSVTIPTNKTSFTTSFNLETGSMKGTYIITIYIKDSFGNVVATRDVTVSYGSSAVSYNANGGSQNLPYDKASYASGDTVTVLFDYIPSRSGYTFLGWSRNSAATTPEFTANGNKTFSIGSGDVALYAVWQANGSAPATPSSGNVVVRKGTSTYSLFNSGATSSNGYDHYRSPNPAPSTYNNNGYDLYGTIGSSTLKRFRLGQSFKVEATITEQATLSVMAYDVDEDVKSCGHGYEYDFVYLVDETDNKTVKLDGHMSGTDDTWANSSFKINPSLLKLGHTYHFELEMSCTGSSSCGYYSVTVRTVSLFVSGNASVDSEEIRHADLKAEISTDGKVTVHLTANAKKEEQYTLEYKVVYAFANEQRGFKEYRVTIPTRRTEFETSFTLETGSKRGTYIITIYIKNNYGNVVASRDVTVSFGSAAISYNANGGSQNLPTDTASYSSGDTATVLFNYLPSRNGYTFLGWSRSNTAKEPEFTVNGNKTFVMGSKDVTLYAVWSSSASTPIAPPTRPKEPPVATGLDVWNGTTAMSFGWGTGTREDPYLIYTAAQLAYLAQTTNNGNTYSGCYFKLMNDLDLAGYEWTPIGKGMLTASSAANAPCFSGVFEGDFHIVRNMVITTNQTSNSGLFGVANNAIIQNLGVVEANISTILSEGCSNCGGLVGTVYNSMITRCFATGSVVSHSSDISAAGGLIGIADTSNTISNCWANIMAEAGNYAGGLVGGFYGTYGGCSVQDSYAVGMLINTGSQKGSVQSGGVVAYVESGKIQNCFFGGTLEGQTENGIAESRANIINCYHSSNATQGAVTKENNLKTQKWVYSTLGWDYDNKWSITGITGYDYPVLRGFDDFNFCHVETGWIYDDGATCLLGGNRHKDCIICGTLLKTETLYGTRDHGESIWVIDVYPTATASGHAHKECSTCHEVLETKILAALASLKIQDVATKEGSKITVAVDIQNNPGIFGAALTFTFDPTLELVSATPGNAFGALSLTKPANLESPCTFVWDGGKVADFSNGTVLILTFELPSNAPADAVYNISASYSFGNVVNAEMENVDISIENGAITVADLTGDANDDGVTNVADLILLRRHVAGGYEVKIDTEQADMNGDGSITVADIVLLRRHLLK